MNKIPTNLLAGAAGALLLNIIHELARHTVKDAPRVQEIGEEGLVKLTESFGVEAPKGETLYASTLAGDLITNALYYSAVGRGKEQHIWLRGLGLGLTAGLGALTLPKPLGLDDKPVKGSVLTQVLTVAWYTFGGLAAAGVANYLHKRAERKEKEAVSDVEDVAIGTVS